MLAFLLCIPAAASALQSSAHDPRTTALVTLDGEHPWEPPGDLAAWQQRAARLRRQILVAAGLWPLGERPPVEAVIHGDIDRGDYRVCKVFFETWPGFFLTGNLYLPSVLNGPAPAVLSPHGHWLDGRFYTRPDGELAGELASGAERSEAPARYPLQARCAQLARMGCVVFHYDMVGYGDARQLGHEDEFSAVEALLWGQSQFGFQTYDSLRALDFLAGLPEVDPRRIGVTGASGGGTQTFILCAIDERPAAAFPAGMVSSAMQGGCVCENAPHLRVDTTNVEIAALMAPRPLALSAADDWTLEIESKGLPQLKRVWALFDAEERVSAHCWPQFGHNYNLHAREMMYGWFDRHLGLGHGQPVREQPFEPIEPAGLSVFDAEHPLPERAGDRASIQAAMRAAAEARLATLVPSTPAELAEFRRVVGGALEVLLSTSLEEVEPVAVREVNVLDGGARELRLVPADDHGDIPATLLAPRDANGTVCVAVSGSGRAALLDRFSAQGAALRAALERGTTILLPEVLLGEEEARGERVALRTDAERHGRYAGYTWCYNRSLIAERARDLLAAIAYAARLPGAQRVVLWGEGRAGPRALLAAALARERVARALVDWSWDFRGIRDLADPNLLPGALRYGGLDSFAGLCAPIELRLAGRREAPATAAACYRAGGMPDHVSVEAAESEGSLAWLAGPP